MRYTEWFEIVDERFRDVILPNVHVDVLYASGRWLEGPVYVPAARHLLFSDIPNNRVLRFNECDNTVSTFSQPSNFTNGNTLDTVGRVVSCQHESRRVIRFEHDGTMTIIADAFEGRRLNSPNDVIVGRSGSIWFTDPTYGISTEYEGSRTASEIGSQNVYRIDSDGAITAVVTDLQQPNGLALTADETVLYVIDSGANPARLMAYRLGTNGMPTASEIVRTCDEGMYDGLRLDRNGLIWTSAGDGVHCLNGQGDLLGKIRLPETVSNLCFGGPAGNRLFITAARNLYAVYLNTTAQRA